MGVKAEKEGMERRSCEGREGTEHTSTDPLMISHGICYTAPSLPWFLRRRVERGQEQPFSFLP